MYITQHGVRQLVVLYDIIQTSNQPLKGGSQYNTIPCIALHQRCDVKYPIPAIFCYQMQG